MLNAYNPLEPLNFRYYCQKVLPAVYDDSLSYYELLCKIVSKVNEIINTDNIQNEGIKKLTEYVNHYFDSLDVQNEINNKLDAMAESNEFAQIIAQYLNTINIYGFLAKSDLTAATNLKSGLYVKTLGNENYKDGDGHYYYIRNKTNSDHPDGDNLIDLVNVPVPPGGTAIVAEKIPDANLALNTRVTDLETQVTAIDGKVKAPTGQLSDLLTPAANLVYGINQNTTALTTLQTTTTARFNAVNQNIGNLADLSTTDDNTIVAAINEVNNKTIGIAKGGTGADNKIDARQNLEVMGTHILYDGTPTNGNIDFTPKLVEYGINQLYKYKYITFFGYMNVDEGETDDGCVSATVYHTPNGTYFDNRINISSTASTTTQDNIHYFKIAHACYDVGKPSNPNQAILVTNNGKSSVLSYDDQNHGQMAWGATWGVSNIYIYRVIGHL